MSEEIYQKRINKLLSFVSDIPGDVIEVGIFKGKTSEIVCKYLQSESNSKRYIGLDTFNGYQEEDMVDVNTAARRNHTSKRWHCSKQSVEKRLSFFDRKRLSIIEGDCKVKIPQLIEKGVLQLLSLIYIDCNLYIPSLKAMEDLWPLLSSGGILAIDEHLVGGETKAIKEFALKNNLVLKYYGDSPGPSYYILK